MARAVWSSRLGFILSVAGSAIGLANIWKFPYTVGVFGGGSFIFLYLLALVLIGFPTLMAEILIGRTTHLDPSGAFKSLSPLKRKSFWRTVGLGTILTGFIVSAFYSVVAGQILGYLIESATGQLSNLSTAQQAQTLHSNLLASPLWTVSYHFLFLVLCTGILYMGVRKGIERACTWMMPLLFLLLIGLCVNGLSLPRSGEALSFLFSPNWSSITPLAVLSALGQAFFTLSLGQGTMVTYGSYLKGGENLLSTCIPVVLLDTLVALLSAVAIFTTVFAAGIQPDSGSGLVFHTLPIALNSISGSYFLSLLFFLLVTIAAITSEISAMEPSIAYLTDERGYSRHTAVCLVGIGAFLLGIPCALATNLFPYTFFGANALDLFNNLTTNLLIPLGGLGALFFVGRVWGIHQALGELEKGLPEGLHGLHWSARTLKAYFSFCILYAAPFLLLLVFLHTLGLFSLTV